MDTFVAVVLFFVGTLLIIKGGDIFVDAAGWVSDVTGISRIVIGATIVSFATTSPEYFVSLIATLKGYNDLAIGNAVGSLICNLGVAFALLAIFTPGKIHDALFPLKGQIMILSAILLFVCCISGALTVKESLLLFMVYALFTFVNIKYSSQRDTPIKKRTTTSREIALNVIKFVAGGGAIILGSNLIVENGQLIARQFGVSEAVIGLTFVAIGTSLPEIVTSISAILKKESALSLGNIIGANTLDATLILATSALVSGGELTVSRPTAFVDLPVAILLMAIAIFPTISGKKLYRTQGILMMLIYGAYLVYVIQFRMG